MYIALLLAAVLSSCTGTEAAPEKHQWRTANTSALSAKGIDVKQELILNPYLDISLTVDYAKVVSSRDIFFRKSFFTVNTHPVISSEPEFYNHVNGFIPKTSVKVYAPAQITGSGPVTVFIKDKLAVVNDIGHWVIAGIDRDNFTKIKLLDQTNGDVAVQLFKPLNLMPAITVKLSAAHGQVGVNVTKSPAGGLTVDIYNSKLSRSFYVNGDTVNEITEPHRD